MFNQQSTASLTKHKPRVYRQRMDETPIERVLRWAKERGWSQTRLADEIGASDGRLSNWKRRGMPPEMHATVARVFGRSIDQLLGASSPESAEMSTNVAERGAPPRIQCAISVVGTARLGENGFYDLIPGGDGHLEGAASDPDAYALRVKGDSMYPAIRDGWFVVVEPNAKPSSEQFVAVQLRDGRKMVKELINARTDALVLESVNGNRRLTIPLEEIEAVHSVTSVVHPSKWKPE
jgi:Predicted transcriptional regulator